MDGWQWVRGLPHLGGYLQCTCLTDTVPVRRSEGGSTQTVGEREKERERARKRRGWRGKRRKRGKERVGGESS